MAKASNRRAKKTLATFPKGLISMGVTSSASEALLALEDVIKEKVLRSAAYAGAEIFYREVRMRVPVDEGTLFDSIYHYHLDNKSGPTKQMYAIGPNKKKAPHWYNVEYGHWRVNVVHRVGGRFVATKTRLPVPLWVPGKPYVRPAYEAANQVALKAMQVRFAQRLREVMSEVSQ
jgi:hypothetical protein